MVKWIEAVQRNQKEYFDAKRAKPRQFNLGDLVLVKISSIVTTGQGRRLRDRYKDIYKMIEKLSADRYKGKNIRGRKYEGVYAIKHMKAWSTFTEEATEIYNNNGHDGRNVNGDGEDDKENDDVDGNDADVMEKMMRC